MTPEEAKYRDEHWARMWAVNHPDEIEIVTCDTCGFERGTDDCDCRLLYPGLPTN